MMNGDDNINNQNQNEIEIENENQNANANENANENESESEINYADVRDELKKINDFSSFDEEENASINLSPISMKKINALTEKRRTRYLPIHIFAFVIPFLLMTIAFWKIKIFPFGEKQIMVIDSWHQYYPFLQELHYKLTRGQSILYSWNTGGGTNFLTLMSYYASTPLYLLSVLFPQEYLREFMALATMIKISCSGLFFSIYLRGMIHYDYADKLNASYDKKYCALGNGFAILGFSALYALSAYAVGYYWCIMWLDCMALLPLVVLGLERMIDSGKFKLYMISLGLTVFSDYYIAIFVCEFIALYYTVLYFTKIKKPSVWGFIIKTVKVVGASAAGVGLAGVMLIPTYFWFGNTGNAGSTFSRAVTTYNSLLDIVTNLLPNTKPAVRAGLPNIACGLIVVIFAALYFMNSKIRLREKLFAGGFLTFMLFSFNLNILDYIWHGGHFPNEIPYRQAFVVSFVLVTIAFKSFMNFEAENINKNTVMKLCLCVFAYCVVAEQWYKTTDKFDFKVFYVAIVLLIVYMTALLLYKNNKYTKNFLAVILMFIMFFEGGMSAVKGATTTGTSDRKSYAPSKNNIQATVKEIYESDEDQFFRLEMSRWFSTNDPALYGFRGISQFSSEANSKYARTLEILGIAATITSNRFLYSSATPVFNAFMSIKYLMAREEDPQYNVNSVAFEEFLRNATTDDDDETLDYNAVVAYKNKYWLPLGFVVSEDIKDINISEPNVFIIQNELMKTSSGISEDVFKSIQQEYNNNINLSESRSEYGVYSYSITDKSKKGTVNHVYVSDKNQQVYLYVRSTRSKTASVSVNGNSRTYEINRGITIDCGRVIANQEINIYFDVDAGDGGSFNLFVAGFNEEAFKTGYSVLKSGGLNIETFKDTNIKGTVNAYENGVFFTSIPYDKGWHIKIDGIEVEVNPKSEAEKNDVVDDKTLVDKKKEDPRQIKKITDGFVTANIAEGEHTIELYYITDGLIPGILLSLLCAAIIIALEIYTRKIEKKRKNKVSVDYAKLIEREEIDIDVN